MDDANTLVEADEDILTNTASDEVLEAAADTEKGRLGQTIAATWVGVGRVLHMGVMSDEMTNLDQTDEDILNSDEAMEAAAGIEGGCHLAFTVVTWCAPTKSMPSGCKRI